MKDLWKIDATELGTLIRQRDVSAREAVQAHLDRLHAVNPKINAIVRDLSDQALAEADAADTALRGGEVPGALHGVPVTTKINTDQTGLPTDNGILPAKDLIATEDSPAIATLRKAGAIVIGRSNAPAVSMRLVTDNALHGLTLNPWNAAVTCGGSSGGAGASLAAGIGAIAQGNDIGGSIRWPAYCNGLVGLRPTIGRVPFFNETGSRMGPRGFAAQLMAVNGPLTRSVRDAALALRVMAAGDPRDPVWTDVPLEGAPARGPLRAALVIEDDLPDATKDAVRRAGRHLAAAGYEVEETAPPSLDRLPALWGDIGMCEIGPGLMQLVPLLGDPGFEKAFTDMWELMGHRDLGRYHAALAERDTILRNWSIFLESRQVVVMPSCGALSLAHDCDTQGRIAEVLHAFRFQIGLPVLGLPGLAVPMGVHDGLPMGVQIIAGKFREDRCLAAGAIIEREEPPIAPIDPRV